MKATRLFDGFSTTYGIRILELMPCDRKGGTMPTTKLTVLCYPRCSTCKRAIKWLDDHAIAYTYRDIAQDNPTAEELSRWHQTSGLPIRRFFNTSGRLYRSLGLKDRLPNMTDEECYELLATDGMLVKRPLAVGEGLVLVGFREVEWETRLL